MNDSGAGYEIDRKSAQERKHKLKCQKAYAKARKRRKK